MALISIACPALMEKTDETMRDIILKRIDLYKKEIFNIDLIHKVGHTILSISNFPTFLSIPKSENIHTNKIHLKVLKQYYSIIPPLVGYFAHLYHPITFP